MVLLHRRCMFLYKDYTITIYLNQYWTDERLSFSDNDEENMTLTGDFTDKIWVPDTFFANDKLSFLHAVTEKNHMIRLYGDGSVVYGMRLVLSRFFLYFIVFGHRSSCRCLSGTFASARP